MAYPAPIGAVASAQKSHSTIALSSNPGPISNYAAFALMELTPGRWLI
jgi:hypothetical protein